MSAAVSDVCWPTARVGEALVALARAAKLAFTEDASVGRVPASIAEDAGLLEQWLDAVAEHTGLEVDPVRVRYAALEDAIRGPMLVKLRAGVVAIAARHGANLVVVCHDGQRRSLRARALVAELRDGLDPEASARADALLAATGVEGPGLDRAREVILREQLADELVEVGFAIGLPPGAPFGRQARDVGLPARVLVVVAAQIAQQAIALLGWWLIGRGALSGRVEVGWLVAWALLLVTSIPIKLGATWLQGTVALGFGVLLKRRMMVGALRLSPDETRGEGAGALLGRIMESEALESLATSGALGSLLAVVELVVAGVVLGFGPGGLVSVLLLSGWAVLGILLLAASLRRQRGWTAARLEMTNALVERMVGHRTRLAQEPREEWHEAEDEQLSAYAARSAAVDRVNTLLLAVLPRGWLVVGALSVAVAFTGDVRSPAALALWLGGVLLGYRALGRLTQGAASLLGAKVASAQIEPLFRAAERKEPGDPSALAAAAPSSEGAVLEAKNVFFRRAARRKAVLEGIDLRVGAGDRLLLEGPSGGGKSTLGAVLAGLRTPESGVLLLRGLDPHTMGGEAWRRRIVTAPQFHENHVIAGTFGFNLLMGRGWPARRADFEEALEVCRELGLGPLLARMPGGLGQMVGETGWQLSHGEKSRLFIARALLQRAEMVVLDESFAALDPKTLELALRCAMTRARALMVIAHP